MWTFIPIEPRSGRVYKKNRNDRAMIPNLVYPEVEKENIKNEKRLRRDCFSFPLVLCRYVIIPLTHYVNILFTKISFPETDTCPIL